VNSSASYRVLFFVDFKGQERQKYFRNKGNNSPPPPTPPIKLATQQGIGFQKKLTAN